MSLNRSLPTILMLMATAPVLALGLGPLQQLSTLNERLDVRIDVVEASGDDMDTMRVQLADEDQFKRAGIDRNAVLLELRFKPVRSEAGSNYIHITSRVPIREPLLNFLLELNWENGRIVRNYTVLFDPPR